jgi:Secretion system C-terminal sorting domain
MNQHLKTFLPDYSLSLKAGKFAKSFIRKIYSSIFLFGLGLTGIQAQEGATAAGGEATGSGGSVSYSIGQVIYTTNTGSNGSVSQGIQQAYEITAVTGIEEAKGINLILSAYPNPTTDFLTLNVENYNNQNLSYQLYDISGQLLESNKLYSNQTMIVMSNYSDATYFLKVIDNNKEVKTFKIIKN